MSGVATQHTIEPDATRGGVTGSNSGPRAALRPPYAAVIFDMDGVVTDTAAIHAEAWKRLFDEVLRDPRLASDADTAGFDPRADYRRYVDGRSREDGVRTFLASRQLRVPEGIQTDGADVWSVPGLGARKNAIFLDLLAEREVRVFPGTQALLKRLRDGHVPTGLVTASRNAPALLAAAGITDLFDVVVDGTRAHELGLAGKPDPAMFIETARLLGVDPGQAAVVEDAIAGVQAARRGMFGLVVGVARQDNRAALEAAGADIVVEDVSQLDLGVRRRTDPWVVTFEGFDPAHEGHREALTTLANGYLGTRGAAPETRADGTHYPGTYLAGVYNRLTSSIQGAAVEDEQVVNVPNWLPFDLRVDDGEWWSAGGLSTERESTGLDLRRGLLVRRVLLTDRRGRRLRLIQRRLVSLARRHIAALETTLVAEGWDGTVTIRSGIDATVTNAGVAEFRALANRHLMDVQGAPLDPHLLVVEAETTSSRIRIATAVRTLVNARHTNRPTYVQSTPGFHAQEFTLDMTDGQDVRVEKTAAIVTSKDSAVASPREGALAELARAPERFGELLTEHEADWAQLWTRFAVTVDGLDAQDAMILNLHLFHLAQTFTQHTAQLDAGVPARGLHGQGYRGHVFWDELFVLPLLTTQAPAVSRAVLEYRWRRLPAARHAASRLGLAGAVFPWQSGSSGREETPDRLFNPRSGRWMPDNSWRQRHVGLAVAFNAWAYYAATADLTWLAERGGELIIDVARAFASMARYDPVGDRFHIEGVMGPDEYHDGYPDTPGSGLRDNACTNVMTAWVCSRALDVLELLRGQACDELISTLHVEPDEPDRWKHLRRRLTVPVHDGIISQFDGYQHLAELDWEHYRSAHANIGRLDLILEAEGDTTNRYKLAKQADVLMLVYLLDVDELLGVLSTLGYSMTEQDLARTVDHYLARTAHGSTLSRVVHTSVLARFDPDRAWALFREALVADLDDTQGGTTKEGVHLGAMAGTVDIVRTTFAGFRISERGLTASPCLPPEIKAVSFRVHYQGHHVTIHVSEGGVHFDAHDCVTPHPLRVGTNGTATVLQPGTSRHLPSIRATPGSGSGGLTSRIC
ncbi:beta-phosphoglucomutase family hydrolase [Nocardioides taihuensis]|uniref:Beta-phosphoglucomutase family hydrolase n=1 Tax=Nocardioides taihuensis TaxID=1835606 RepID=A0ABW0BDL1_9ACTN